MLSLIWSVFCLVVMESRIAWRTPLTTTSVSESELSATTVFDAGAGAGACCAHTGTPIEARIANALVRHNGMRIRLGRLFAFTDTPPTCLTETLVF